MRKPNSNSNWNQLTGQQRALVEKWLFDEHLGYEAALDRVKNEFGLEASRASLCRFYQRRARERQVYALMEAQAMSDAVANPRLDTDSMRAAAVKLIAKTTLKLACERPEQLKDLESLAKILLISEDNDIRRGRLKLEQDQFIRETEDDVSGELPKLARLLVKIEEDDDLSE
jgi:hypothetical protein